MLWAVGYCLIMSILGLGRGHNTLFEGYDRSLSGYHLCSVNESVLVTHVISYPTSYTQRRPCGGWLPWTMCDVTFYKTSYLTEFSNMSKQVMKCCHGYEQVGSYCALSLNRSTEFTSKPGLCPSAIAWNDANPSGSLCQWDIDCPKLQKCCPNETTSQCVDPLPPVNRSCCFNVTITVKTAIELVTMDKGLFNHTRLLHSVVTGVLGTNGTSVYHLWSRAAGLFTTSSSLLVCSSVVLSLENISTRLHLLGKIEEVTNVVVEDVDECADPELNDCSDHANCNNTVGSYVCICHHGYQDLVPTQPGKVCIASKVTTQPSTTESSPTTTSHHTMGTPYTDVTQFVYGNATSGAIGTSSGDQSPSPTCNLTPVITSIFSYNVTNSTFSVTWTTNNQTGVKFHLVLLQGTTELENYTTYTTSLHWMITGLKPGLLYTVRITPIACENIGSHMEVRVRTDGQTLSATARLIMMFTESLSDPNSEEYKAFCQSVITEILSSLPAEMYQLVVSGEVAIQVTSLSNGSVIVNFTIIFQPNTNLNMVNVSSELMSSLKNSLIYTVDSNSIHIEDLNECLLGETDCSLWANCINTFGSYTCDCSHGYTDLSPSRPGRSCAESPPQSSTVSSTSSIDHTTDNPITSLPSTAAPTVHVSQATATSVQTSTSITTTASATTHQTNRTGVPGTSTTQATLLTSTATSLTTSTISSGMHTTSHLLPSSNIAVQCLPDFIFVRVRRDYLQYLKIPENSLFLGQPECGSSVTNSTHVQLVAAWNKCGTTVEHNSTHNTVNVTLYNRYLTAIPVSLAVPIICTYPSSIIISTGYSPTGIDVLNDIVEGSGSFQVTVRLLNGTFPLPENYTLSPDEEVIVEVAVNTTIPQIKVIINKCWATPTSDSSLLNSIVFLDNGCPTLNSHTTVIQNGNDTVSLLSVQVFALIEGNVVYLHCQIQICVEIQDNACRPACLGRAFRSSSIIRMTKATFGPLLRLNTLKPPVDQTSNIIQTVGFVLLGVGVFLLSLAAIAGLVYHKRKIGTYSFSCKPQQENFTYHVFDT